LILLKIVNAPRCLTLNLTQLEDGPERMMGFTMKEKQALTREYAPRYRQGQAPRRQPKNPLSRGETIDRARIAVSGTRGSLRPLVRELRPPLNKTPKWVGGPPEDQKQPDKIVEKIDNRPRKVLGCLTPYEVFSS
jgi:hypothetical protein